MRFAKREMARLWENYTTRNARVVVLPRIAVCETCPDAGFAPSSGLWAPSGAAHFRCCSCNALGSAETREAVVEERKSSCDPLFLRTDIFIVCQ